MARVVHLSSAAGGAIYYGANWLVTKLKIDDPVAATPIHLVCGIWGLIATGGLTRVLGSSP
jgi:Amt family ammonium transporter